jgi:peptidoglycan-associated lipoprotein
VYYDYGQVLKMNQSYDSAIAKFELYKKEVPSDPNVDEQIAVLQKYLEGQAEQCHLFDVELFRQVNSAADEFAPMILKKDGLVFTSDRDDATGKKRFPRTGLKYTDLFILGKVKVGKTEKYTKVTPIKGPVNTDENQGTASFDDKGNVMYYTDCQGPRADDPKKKTPNCVIKMVRKKGQEWGDPETLPFCSDTTLFYGHPALSPDGTSMIFASNNPSGKGGHDLWLTTYVKKSRTWSDPVNLGDQINTMGNEEYPYFYDDTTLYFASSGLPGLGGLDIFVTTGAGTTWSKPVHLRETINSGGDDFGITFDDTKKKGFFTSNRVGSRRDDIYSFSLVPQSWAVDGVVYDCKTMRAKKDASVILEYKNSHEKEVKKVDAKGYYTFNIKRNEPFTIFAKARGYFNSRTVDTLISSECSFKATKDLYVCPPPDTAFKIEGIFYGLDSANIRPQSKHALDSLVGLMNLYPFFVVEIGSHTDCRASYHHNDSLSQARADSVVHYLVSHGIERERLDPHGYGERQLVNNCGCEPNDVGPGKDCTELQHQANRRTTFKIIRSDYVSPNAKDEDDDGDK